MMKLRSVTAGTVAAAMLATSATPAMAQGYPGGYGYGRPGVGYGYGYGYGYGGGYRRHRDHGDAGAVIAGVAVVGIIAAIAAAASSSKNRNYNNDSSYNARGSIGTEDAAADACANAAESRAGRDARVTSVDDVVRSGDGYSVRGTIETNGYRANDRQSFTCSVRYGNVERVDLGATTAYRGY